MRSLGAGSCSVIGMLIHWTPLYLGIMITAIKSCNKNIRASFAQVSIVILSLVSTFFPCSLCHGNRKNLAGRKYGGIVVGNWGP